MCSISKHVAHTRFIDNEGCNSHEDFGVTDGKMDILKITKRLVSRAIVTRVNLGTVQIKKIQDLVWRIHDLQTHNPLLIVAEFG